MYTNKKMSMTHNLFIMIEKVICEFQKKVYINIVFMVKLIHENIHFRRMQW